MVRFFYFLCFYMILCGFHILRFGFQMVSLGVSFHLIQLLCDFENGFYMILCGFYVISIRFFVALCDFMWLSYDSMWFSNYSSWFPGDFLNFCIWVYLFFI